MYVLLSMPGLTIAHDAANRRLITTWYGRHNGREKQALCERILEKVGRTASTTLLSDGSQDLDGWGEVVRWISDEYHHDLGAAGIKAVALVVPHNMTAHADVNQALALIARRPKLPADPVAIDTFQDVEAASSWLQNAVFSGG